MTPITHRNREIKRLERELAESREECKRLREALKSAYKLSQAAPDGNSELENKVGLNRYAGLLEDSIIQVRQDLRKSLETALLAPKVGDK